MRESTKMARNSEKHFVGLNRIFLEEQWKKDRERKRPHLSTLQTAGEVRKWIPSIKREMNYCIEQLSGARKHDYTDGKLKEFEERLGYLERDYKRFIQKVFQLDPSSKDVPWEARPYKRRNQQGQSSHGGTDRKKSKLTSIEICQDLLEDKQNMSDSEDDKDLSPLLPEIRRDASKSECSDELTRIDHLIKQNLKEQEDLTVKNSVQSLVAYDSSDSDET